MSGQKPSGTTPGDVPDLILPSPSKKPEAAPQRTASAPKMAAVNVPHDAKAIAISVPDDDDEMEIEREGGPSMMGMQAPSSAPRRAPPPSHTSPGIELGAPLRVSARPRSSAASYEATATQKAIGGAIALVAFGGTAIALVRLAHRAGGRPLSSFLPHAFDGSSTAQSGAVSLGALVGAIALGYLGAQSRPKVFGFLVAATAFLLTSFAMVTVTLVSTEENPVPADGLLLLPYSVPAALLTFGIGLAERGASLFASGRTSRRVLAVPLAAIGGALAFFAYETSFLVLMR